MKGRAKKGTLVAPNPRARTRDRADIVTAICRRIRRGTHINHACALEGIGKVTLHDWRHADPGIVSADSL